MIKHDEIKMSVSLYSFSIPFMWHEMDLEDCLRTASEMGFEGIEIVASQMVPCYPNPTEEWFCEFERLLKKYNLHLVCWSAYIDMGLRSDRELTDDEIYRFACNDLVYAKRLGAELVRSQFGIGPGVLKRMIPVCRELDIKMCIELHNPHGPDTPIWQEFLEIMDSPENAEGWIGVCPDLGIFQTRPNPLAMANLANMGIGPDIVEKVLRGELSKEAVMDPAKYDEADLETIFYSLHTKAAARPEDIMKVMGHTMYIHGKFHYVNDDLTVSYIPYDEIMPYIRDNFKGYITAEYEGHGEAPEDISVAHLNRYITMMKRYLGEIKK